MFNQVIATVSLPQWCKAVAKLERIRVSKGKDFLQYVQIGDSTKQGRVSVKLSDTTPEQQAFFLCGFFAAF